MTQPPCRLRPIVMALCLAAPVAGQAQDDASDSVSTTDAVVVTADRLQMQRDESSAPIRVITREQLDTLPVRDVASALDTLPNVFVQRTGSVFDEATISSYGISGQGRAPTRDIIAINGVPLNNGMFPETSLNMLPINLVERIEMVQGPASSAYGNNAFTGVVNLVTRKPAAATGNATAQIGTRWNTGDFSGYLGTGSPEQGWIIASAELRQTDGHLQPGGREDFSDSRLTNFALLGEKRFGDTALSGAALVYDFDRHNPSLILRSNGPTPPGPTAYHEDGYRQHFNIGLTHAISAGWDAEVRYTYNTFSTENRQTFRVPNPPQTPPSSEDRKGQGVLARVTWTTSMNILSVGYEYADAELENNITDLRFKGHSNGFYIQDRLLLLNEQLSLSAGYRYDDFSTYEDPSESWKVGFAFKPTASRWLLRGNIGQSFAAPAFNQLFNASPPFGNPDLKAERLLLWEVGAEFSPLRNLRLGASYFEAEHKDPIFPRPVGPGGQNMFVNVSPNPEYDGVTLTLDWVFLPGWSVAAAYTYIDPGTFTFHQNKSFFKGMLTYAKGRWSFSGEVIGANDRYWGDNFQAPADDFTVVNLRGSFRLSKHVQLLAYVENLFDEDYATRADRQGIAAGQEIFVPVPRPGRFALLGASVSF